MMHSTEITMAQLWLAEIAAEDARKTKKSLKQRLGKRTIE